MLYGRRHLFEHVGNVSDLRAAVMLNTSSPILPTQWSQGLWMSSEAEKPALGSDAKR